MIKVPSSKKQQRDCKSKQQKQLRRPKRLPHEASIYGPRNSSNDSSINIYNGYAPKYQDSVTTSESHTNESYENYHFQTDLSRFINENATSDTIEKEIKRFNRIRHKGGSFTGIKLDKTGKLKIFSKSPLERRKKSKKKNLIKVIVKSSLNPQKPSLNQQKPSAVSHKISTKNGIKTTLRREKAHEALFKRKPLKPLIMQKSDVEHQKPETIDNFSVMC